MLTWLTENGIVKRYPKCFVNFELHCFLKEAVKLPRSPLVKTFHASPIRLCSRWVVHVAPRARHSRHTAVLIYIGHCIFCRVEPHLAQCSISPSFHNPQTHTQYTHAALSLSAITTRAGADVWLTGAGRVTSFYVVMWHVSLTSSHRGSTMQTGRVSA